MDELKENVTYLMENLNFRPDEHSYVEPWVEPCAPKKEGEEDENEESKQAKDPKKMSAAEKKKYEEELKRQEEEESKMRDSADAIA